MRNCCSGKYPWSRKYFPCGKQWNQRLSCDEVQMSARDVSDTLDDAIEFTSLDQVHIKHKPRLLSDNGSSYVASELKTYLDDQGMPIPEEGLTIQ